MSTNTDSDDTSSTTDEKPQTETEADLLDIAAWPDDREPAPTYARRILKQKYGYREDELP